MNLTLSAFGKPLKLLSFTIFRIFMQSDIEKRGIFVVCEGPHYSGKTINIKRAIEKLQGLGCNAGYNRGAGDNREIEAVLYIHPTTETFLLSILYETVFNVRPKLRKHDVLFQDRYLISVLAHMCLKAKPNEKLVEYVEEHAEKPDLVVYFTATPEERMRRLRDVGIRAHHYKLLEGNQDMIKRLDQSYSEIINNLDCELFVIDTTNKPIETTSDLLVDKVRQIMTKK